MQKSKRMADEVVVITGASAGVGRATARRFAKDGARIALLARGSAGLNATAREVEEFGGKAFVCPTDVADPRQVEEAATRIEHELGPITIWINNAMVSVFSPFSDMTPEEYRRVTEVTYLGQVYGTMSALRRMKKRNAGTIIQVGSALAYRGIPLQSAYCGAKHAIQGFTESLRCELLHDGSNIHLCMVHLPALNTPQFKWSRNRMPFAPQPMPPIYQPEVAADGIHHAAVHKMRELKVGLSTEIVIEGNKLAPSLGDWYLARKGYEGQRSKITEKRPSLDNLFRPVDQDFGAHGDFNHVARSHSMKISNNMPLTTLALLGAASIMGMIYRQKVNKHVGEDALASGSAHERAMQRAHA